MVDEVTVTEEVAELCATYGLDAVCVVRELNEFRLAYRRAHHMITIDDLASASRGRMTQKTSELNKTQSRIVTMT